MYNLLLYGHLAAADPPSFVDNVTGLAQGWRRSTRATGGYWLGSFQISGENIGREYLEWWYNNYLGNYFEEQTFGLTSWEGLVYEMNLTLDGIRYRRTLDKEWFHNRINVYYRDANVQANAGWSEDIDSSGKYGEMNYIDTIGEATAAGAAAIILTRLEDYAHPRSRMVGGLEFSEGPRRMTADQLQVTVAGYISTMNWRYREASISATAADTAITTLVGASEFVTAGTIDTNALSIDADCTTPQRLWDLCEDIILQGDSVGNRWVGGVYEDRQFDYNAAATTVGYYIRGGDLFDGAGQRVTPSLLKPDFIVRNANAPSGGTPIGGNVWDDPRNAWITEVEFIAPDGLRLKPAGFEDVDILKEQAR
jgi:hypothetical protein